MIEEWRKKQELEEGPRREYNGTVEKKSEQHVYEGILCASFPTTTFKSEEKKKTTK